MFIKGALEIILNGSLVYYGCLLIEKAMGDWGLFIHLSPLNWFLSHEFKIADSGFSTLEKGTG